MPNPPRATTHEDIQSAIRAYMARSFGRYPQVLEASIEVLVHLAHCQDARQHMRSAWLTDGGSPCEFILYLGMWLLPMPDIEGFRLTNQLPVTSGGRALSLCPPPAAAGD